MIFRFEYFAYFVKCQQPVIDLIFKIIIIISLVLIIVALELDYQSEKCQIIAMSIWCPMMTSSMMTVQKGQ